MAFARCLPTSLISKPQGKLLLEEAEDVAASSPTAVATDAASSDPCRAVKAAQVLHVTMPLTIGWHSLLAYHVAYFETKGQTTS